MRSCARWSAPARVAWWVGRSASVPGDADFESLRDEFLSRYEARMARETRVFEAMAPVLERLRSGGIPWGIVTNKATRFSEPLVAAMGLHTAAGTLVCGDTTPHAKPHPAPLLEAARRMGFAAADCLYVGDDLRDVQAGRAAGMTTVAAAWGYLGEGESIEAWGADHVIQTPRPALDSARLGLRYEAQGLTWLRRGCGVGTGHAEHQFARKSTGNKVTANDSTYALAA